MLQKSLFILPLVVMASAVLLPSIQEPSVEHQKVFEMGFQISNEDPHTDGSSYRSSDLVKRDGDFVSLPIFNHETYYTTELYLGSRGQRLEVKIDAKTASLWILGKHGHCLTSYPMYYPCRVVGFSSKLRSKTFKPTNCVLNEDCPFDASPELNFGEWGSDKVGTSKTMLNMDFVVAGDRNFHGGFLGIGVPYWKSPSLEAKYKRATFAGALKDAGYIKKLAYSLFFNKIDAKEGSILFGAVDHWKYFGTLQTIPIVDLKVSTSDIKMGVILNKIYLENSNQKVVLLDQPISTVFLTTSDYQILPKNIILALAESMSEKPLQEFYLFGVPVDCGYQTSTGNIVYELSGIKIKVPVSDLIKKFDGHCLLQVSQGLEYKRSHASLGLSFLRHAYLSVDLEKKEISMAQTKFSNLEEIEEISSSVPRAVKAPGYSFTSVVTDISRPTVAKFEIDTDE